MTGSYADLPLRWKILSPFALLSLLYGVSGTYVFARGAVAERRGRLTAELRDVAGVATNALQRQQQGLLDAVRLTARTEGVGDAVARGDRQTLRRLVLPPVVNSSRSLAIVTDLGGTALLEVRDQRGGDPRIITQETDAGDVELLRAAAAIDRDRFADAPVGVLSRGDAWYVAAALPIRGQGAAVGVALIGDRLEVVLAETAALTDSQLSFLTPRGDLMVGPPVPPRKLGSSSLQIHDAKERRSRELLYMPVSMRGTPVGVLVVGLPARAGLGVLGGDAWKIGFLTIAVLAGVALVGVWVAGRISQPIRSLLDATRGLRRGELDYRADADRNDELGELADSFNAMAQEIQASHENLERRVEQRTSELQDALARLDLINEELSRVSEAKSAFLGNMSHELRTPLNAMLLAAELLKEPKFRPKSERAFQDTAAAILSNGRHLFALIDDLLDLSRIEHDRLQLVPQRVPLEMLLNESAAAIGMLAEEKRVRLDIPNAGGVRIWADPLRIRQILVNLLSNAVKCTQPGGRVWVEIVRERRALAIAVRDTGIGIAAKDVKRIFEPFEQASDSSRGAGLGLAISQRLALLHGGAIRVSSKRGAGSTFTLVLPQRGARVGDEPPVRRRLRGSELTAAKRVS